MTIEVVLAAVGGTVFLIGGLILGEPIVVFFGLFVLVMSGLLIWWFKKTGQFP